LAFSEYRPAEGVEGFYLSEPMQTGSRILFYGNPVRYRLMTKPTGFTPKSGLLVCQCLDPKLVSGKTILEIGTGETAVISHHCVALGAINVTATDTDSEALRWAKYNAVLNGFSRLRFQESDVYDGLNDEKYGLIISNPPQMPMLNGPPHDSGGPNGRAVVERIIAGARDHLVEKGEVILLLFDFLFCQEATTSQRLNDCLDKAGLTIVERWSFKKILRPGGETERSIDRITNAYPDFEFRIDENGRKTHEIIVVRIRLSYA
jgi:methylase of polypeptide subunit release factors